MSTVVKRKGSPYFQVRFFINGDRFERSTGETRRRAAEAKAELIIETERARITKREQSEGWRSKTFASAVSAYIDQDPNRDLRFLDKALAHFGEWPLGAIDNAAMANAAAAFYPGRAPATVKRQLYTPVIAVINFARDEKLRPPKGDNRRTHWLWPEQAKALVQQTLKQPSPYLPAMMLFLIGQGPRMGEMLAIDAARDINLEHAWCMLRDTKNGHERQLTLQPNVIAALSRLPTIGQPGPLFRRFDGLPFTARKGRGGQIRNPFAYAVKAAGLPAWVTPHVLRHTWATWFYAATQDELLLKRQGGWRSNEYQRYTHLAPATLPEELEKHGWHFMQTGENRGKDSQTATKSTA